MLVDRVLIRVRSGRGGDGCVAFRREKFVPRGGPAGGDGGHGGDVIVTVDPALHTLLDLRYHQHWHAEDGRPGEGSRKTGKSGADLVVPVPPGTLVRDVEADALLGDLMQPGQTLLVAKGGKGGLGNARFKSSIHQTPTKSTPGGPGEELTLELELKLIADVGLVGLPNAGKSTLLAALSAARPKIGDYPFTTLEPNLGLVRTAPERSLVMADVPGLIAGRQRGPRPGQGVPAPRRALPRAAPARGGDERGAAGRLPQPAGRAGGARARAARQAPPARAQQARPPGRRRGAAAAGGSRGARWVTWRSVPSACWAWTPCGASWTASCRRLCRLPTGRKRRPSPGHERACGERAGA